MLDIRQAIRENDWLRFDRHWPVARLAGPGGREADATDGRSDLPTSVGPH
jgi:hypothetical protein